MWVDFVDSVLCSKASFCEPCRFPIFSKKTTFGSICFTLTGRMNKLHSEETVVLRWLGVKQGQVVLANELITVNETTEEC